MANNLVRWSMIWVDRVNGLETAENSFLGVSGMGQYPTNSPGNLESCLNWKFT